jgi:hypothetical protein
VPNFLNGQFSCCLSDLLSLQRRPRRPIQDDDAELWISRPWTSVCLGFGFCCLPPPFPGGVPQLGRTKLTRKTIDDITELADGENRRCIRGIAGLKTAATTALKRYANIFLWLTRRRNIIVSSIYVHAWLFYSDMKYGCKRFSGLRPFMLPIHAWLFSFDMKYRVLWAGPTHERLASKFNRVVFDHCFFPI